MLKTNGLWETRGQWDDLGRRWTVNYSSILSQLIFFAGRYCDDYSSDLFIFWEYHILKNMDNRDWQNETAYLAFRDMGIDWATKDIEYDQLKENFDKSQYMYRKIVELHIEADGKNIFMTLKDVAYLTKRQEGTL